MRINNFHYLPVLLFCSMLLVGVSLFAQGQGTQPATASAASTATPAAAPGTSATSKPENAAVVDKKSGSEEASGEKEDPAITEMKHSAVIKWLSRHTGLSDESTYWLFTIVNFLILLEVLRRFIPMLLGKKFPALMKDRNQSISKGIEEARAASSDADARLAAIEQRLAALDGEVAKFRADAEAVAEVEQKSIQQQAGEEARLILENATREIETVTRAAQRELMNYQAELSVALAEKLVQVDTATDAALVRKLAGRLDKEAK